MEEGYVGNVGVLRTHGLVCYFLVNLSCGGCQWSLWAGTASVAADLCRHFDEAGNYIEDKEANKGDEWLEGVAVYKGPVVSAHVCVFLGYVCFLVSSLLTDLWAMRAGVLMRASFSQLYFMAAFMAVLAQCGHGEAALMTSVSWR